MFHLSAISIALLAAVFGFYRIFTWFTTPKLNLPVVGSAGDADFSNAALQGFEKYPDTPFLLPSNPNVVMLPLSLYMETKNHPAAHHNLERATRFMSRWTHADVENEEIFAVIRKDLAKNISTVLPLIQDEARYAFRELNISSEWKQILIQPTAQRIIALITSRVFVGNPVGRSEEWLDLSMSYTTALGHVQDDYNRLHPLVTRFMAPFLKSVRVARHYFARADPLLQPLVSEILSREKEGKGPLTGGSSGALISWLLNYLPKKDQTTYRISQDQLGLAVAAIHNTSNTTTFALINLAEHLEIVDELRSEIEAELAQKDNQVDQDGQVYLGKAGFANLKKLDSFVKESMRYSGVFSVNPLYKLTANATFSSGLKLPKGTRIGFSTRGVSMSETNPTLAPAFNEKAGNSGPEVFDAFRFERLRKLPDHEAKHQAVTTGLDYLVWGHGPHACPGRFLAIYEIKCVLIELLLNYDFRLNDSIDGQGGQAQLPRGIKVGLVTNPNPLIGLEIRKRAA